MRITMTERCTCITWNNIFVSTLTFTDKITVTKIQSMGGDAMIAAAAWVSTSPESAFERSVNNPDDVSGVIKYLVKQRHGSPFEHGALTMYTKAPLFVYREWHRHRIGHSYNEESARYKVLDPVFYIPPTDRPMFKVDDWKPGRPKFLTIEQEFERIKAEKDPEHVIPDEKMPQVRYDRLVENLQRSYELSYEMYEENLALGVDPGLARDCLPVGIYSSCWVTVNPRSLMAFLSLRTHEPERAKFVSYPLYEIEVAARAAEQMLKEGWPITYQAFVDNGFVAP